MQFWHVVSQFFQEMPERNRTFVEYSWDALLKMTGQLRFDVQNAIASLSPTHIPVYNIKYWQVLTEPWATPENTWTIPTLADRLYNDNPNIYVIDTDYNVANDQVTWLVSEPTDYDMAAGNVDAWTLIDTPTIQKVSPEGTNWLEIAGDTDEGVSGETVNWDRKEHVRARAIVENGTEVTVQLRQGGAVLASATGTTTVTASADVEAAGVTVAVLLTGDGTTAHLSEISLGRYPRDGRAFAEQVLCYNPYLDTKSGYDYRFLGINEGAYRPDHARMIMQALNYVYRTGDTERALEVGLTAILGLPFAWKTGTITAKRTSGDWHELDITDADGTVLTMYVATSLADAGDLPATDTAVEKYDPLLETALKVKPFWQHRWQYWTTAGTPGSWSVVGTATTSSVGGYTEVSAPAAGEGVKSDPLSVTADEVYVVEGVCYVASGAQGRFQVYDETNDVVLAEEWFGDTDAETVQVPVTIPAGCTEIATRLVSYQTGTFYYKEVTYHREWPLYGRRADVTATEVLADLVLTDRAGGNLTFQASDYVTGSEGNYIEVAIVASGADQAISSTLSGSGTAGDPYVYTLTTGNAEASQNSNNAIAAYVNNDALVYGLLVCTTPDDETADPTYSLVQTALSGGVDPELSLYSDLHLTAGATVAVRNTTQGTQETKILRGVGAGAGDYTEVLTLAESLTGAYAGTDEIVVLPGKRNAGYIDKIVIYNRWQTSYNMINVNTFLSAIRDQGYTLTFKDAA